MTIFQNFWFVFSVLTFKKVLIKKDGFVRLRLLPLRCLQHGDGASSHCNALDSTFITSSTDPEVAVLTPAAAPAILHDPVLLSSHVAAAISHQEHCVVGQLEGVYVVGEARMVVDAPLVAHEVRVDLRID